MLYKKIGVLPEEMANQITTCPKIAYGVKNSRSGECYIDGMQYKITEEQRRLATEVYPSLIKQFFVENKGKLIFEGAGSSIPMDCYHTDVGNYRIRCHIINPKGRRFYIEMGGNSSHHAHNSYRTYFDHVIDRDMEDDYNAKILHHRKALNEKFPNGWGYGPMTTDEDFINYKKYQNQPYNWYKKELWYNAKIPYTKKMILLMVNEIFECNFTEMIVVPFFVTHADPDGFASKSN